MKRLLAGCGVFILLSLAIPGAYATDDSKGKKAEKKVNETLPAQPPQESTGTTHGSGLKPNDGKQRPPKYKEVPPPPKEKKKK